MAHGREKRAFGMVRFFSEGALSLELLPLLEELLFAHLELHRLTLELLVGLLGGLFRAQQGVLELLTLVHAHEDAVGDPLAGALPPNGVAEGRDVVAILRPQQQEDLLGPPLQPDQREEVRLIKDPAAEVQNGLEASALELV